eukprot:COSAG02_NODE_8595_length_2510_cov_4.053090_1_plen_286_part_10
MQVPQQPAVAVASAQPVPGTPVAVAVAQPIGYSGAQQPAAMAVAQPFAQPFAQPPMGGLPGAVTQPFAYPPMGGLPGTETQPISVEEPTSHNLHLGDKVTVKGGVWKGETCTMVADHGAKCQVDFNKKKYTVSKHMCFDLQGNCIGTQWEKQAGHSGAQQPAGNMAVAQPPTAAGYSNAVVTIAPARRSSSSSSDDDVFDMVASVEAEANRLYKGFCGKCESCLLNVYKKTLRPCLLAVWTCMLAVWRHPVGKMLLTLGGWLVPKFKNEDGDPDINKSKCLDDDPD